MDWTLFKLYCFHIVLKELDKVLYFTFLLDIVFFIIAIPFSFACLVAEIHIYFTCLCEFTYM